MAGRDAASPPRTMAYERSATQEELLQQIDGMDQWKKSSRRGFMSQVIGIFSLAPAATAIESSNSKGGYGSGSIITPGNVAVSKKVGGLANKIRGICVYMVRCC